LANRLHAILREAGPLTAEELCERIHRDGSIPPERYPVESIRSELNDHSESINWRKGGEKWPLLFKPEPESRPQKWGLTGLPPTSPEREAETEQKRQITLGKIARRPDQAKFSADLRRNYAGACAITGCQTAEALEAAHIRLGDRSDFNGPDNGLLLRADIHALFDALLFTLTPDGKRLEVSVRLTDPAYDFLRTVRVGAPCQGPAPAETNIASHRERFLKSERSSDRPPGES
jgi:hypothetical protein